MSEAGDRVGWGSGVSNAGGRNDGSRAYSGAVVDEPFRP